ncbi:MAG: hypothetical protein IKY71_06005 [Bacteroidaceae bacterium]|nr:hypothetical protein [Bacteroidaceae bacterium]
MKRISILVITITFFCAIYAAVGSGNNDVVKRYEFYARPFAVLDSTQAVTDTVAISSDSTVAMVAVDTFTTNIDSINVAVDTLTTNVDSINVAVDTLTTNIDSINVTVDTLATNVDSINVAIDTLTTNVDSINVAVDTLATTVDSIEVAVDTLTTKADSVAVDSVVKKSTVPDSLLIGYMPKVNEWKYFSPTELSPGQLDALRTLYKREYEEGLDISPPGELFNTWKLLFTSTPEKTLDLYVEGVSIIHSKIDIDTILNKRYDRMLEFRDELMELYDMAVSDIGRLNSQIDRTKSKDTLSVAKLRAHQVYSYLGITADYREFTVDTMPENGWRQYMLNKDRDVATFAYPRYREMLKCNDLNIDMIHLYYFAILANNKVIYDKAVGLSVEELKENFINDKSLLLQRADSILLNLEAKTSDKTVRDATNNRNHIEVAMRQAEGYFVRKNDYAGLENHYASRLPKEGDDPNFRAEVLNSPLRAYAESNVYLDILRREYKDKPSYASAKQIAVRYYRKYDKTKIVQDFKDCYTYYKNAIEYYSQGTEEITDEEKFKTYMAIIVILTEQDANKKYILKDNRNKLKYIKEVINLNPSYPEVYYFEALMLYEVGAGILNKDKFQAAAYFIVAYDLFNKSLKLMNEGKNVSDPLIKTNDKLEKNIKQYIASSRDCVPSSATYHMERKNGLIGTKQTLKYNGYSYTFTWIARENL